MARSILVVDDNVDVAHVLAQALTEEGYVARCAYDGEAALAEIAHAPPDLVVSDVSMPRLDGVTLTKLLRARGVRIPVVLVSAEVHAVPVPDVMVLPKPVDLDDLARLIGPILAESAAQAAPG
jgi:CheY-like chemotaxis protein